MELTEKQQEKYNEIFLKYDCDDGQAEEIFLGIEKGLDISWCMLKQNLMKTK